MGMMEIRRAIQLSQPHPVTLSGGLVHFETDMAGFIQLTGTGNITICGKNLFDKTAAIQGKYINSSGAIVNAPSGYNWSITDYLPVSDAQKIRYWRIGSSGSSPYSAWYTADKTLISTWKQSTTTNSNNPEGYVKEVPSNAAFVRMSILFNNINENIAMIIIGDEYISGVSEYMAYTGTTIPAGTPRKSLVGINNIWSDSGNVKVTYWTH